MVQPYDIDPDLDLTMTRVVDVPKALIWKAWTQPEHLKKWFTPAPYQTIECNIDLRPGGMFRTVMRSPEGVETENIGCYLEIVENEKLVWTDALGPGYRPASQPNECFDHFFTAVVLLEPHGNGTKYTVYAFHANRAGRDTHEEQGFHDGWGGALDQMVAMIKSEQ